MLFRQTTYRLTRRIVAPALAATTLLVAPALLTAQEINESDYLEGLTRLGLTELIEHYVETKSIDDPIVPHQARIALAQATIFSTDRTVTQAQRSQALDQVITAYNNLFDNNPTETRRLEWSRDYARLLLERVLTFDLTSFFVEYGSPTAEQQEKFDRLTAEAWFMLDRGALAWFDIQGRVPREPGFDQLRIDGTWTKLNRLGNTLIPFYRAQASYLVTYQPDDGEYFKRQAADHAEQGISYSIAEDRKELLAKAMADVETVMEIAAEFDPRTRAELIALKGRILVRQGKAAEGLETLNESVKLANEAMAEYGPDTPAGSGMNFSLFFIQLARSKALAQHEQLEASIQILDDLRKHSLLVQNPNGAIFLYLLLADREATMYEGDKRFDPYQKLLADTDIPANTRQTLQALIEDRIYKQVDVDTLDMQEAPIFVVRAVANRAMDEGNRILRGGGDRNLANTHLVVARKAFKTLIDERLDEIAESDRPRLMLNYGSTLWSLKEQRESARTFYLLARDYKNSEEARLALPTAYRVIGLFYDGNRNNAEIKREYEDMLKLVLSDYKSLTSEYASAQYEYPAFLFREERWQEAVDWYERLPKDSQYILPASYERTVATYHLWEEADPISRVRLQTTLVEAIRDYLNIAKPELDREGITEEQRNHLRGRIADTMLIEASLRADNGATAQEALATLDRLDRDYKDIEGVASRGISIRIRALSALGRFDEVSQMIDRIKRDAPDQAGGVIRSVITAVNSEIRQRLSDNKPQEARDLAAINASLARGLREWFIARNPEADAGPFIIMEAQSYVSAGQFEPALKLLEELYQQPKYRRNRQVLEAYADALFDAGEYGRASRFYNEMREATEQNDALHWKAVARQLSAMDRAAEAKGEGVNPNIYVIGNRYLTNLNLVIPAKWKDEMTRLRNKHTPR